MLPEGKISRAKKAQMKRMGGGSPQGSRKRCRKGKSCGSSCINNSKVCWVDFPWAMSNSITRARETITSRRSESPRPSAPVEPSNPTNRTKDARLLANEVDERIAREGLSSQRGDRNYNWDASKGAGSKFIGEGSYGTVTKEGETGRIVKRGEIGAQEAKAIEKVGNLGLGPKLIASEEDGIVTYTGSPDIRIGRVAMTLVPGEPIGRDRGPEDRIGGQKVADAYWRARANIHRAGVAHNDMHINNVLIDDRGRGRFVDFGMSVVSPKAALAEAMGAFAGSMSGDYQAKRWKGTGGEYLRSAIAANASPNTSTLDTVPVLKKVWGNRAKVLAEMDRDGLSASSIRDIVNHGIGGRPSSFTRGVWGTISDGQAQKYIKMLYEGV